VCSSDLIENRQQLVEWLEKGCKPKDAWRIGTEHEKFGYYLENHNPVPYEGDKGIRALLEGMQANLGWEPIFDEGNLIGLFEANGNGAISLEPGGQFELSGAPLKNIHETCKESNAHLAMVKTVAGKLGIGFLGLGGSPLWNFEETPRMPKSRYEIMANYMPKVGSQGHDMMFRTCTIQVNVDFESEKDMVRKLQVSLKLQSMASALFANSPFTHGKPNGLLSWRSDIWRDTDNQRGGFHAFMLEKNFGFESYVDWVLDIPMYFVIRDNQYHDCTHVTFRQFMDGALKGEINNPDPTVGDWNNHLTTLFPDVRLKRYMEMRGADGGPWRRICALPAFWVGLLYSQTSLDAAEDYTSDWSAEMVEQLRDAVPKEGFRARIANRDLLSHSKEILELSRQGLMDRACLNDEGFDETVFLSPLQEAVASGKTPAELMLNKYHGDWSESIEPLFEEYSF